MAQAEILERFGEAELVRRAAGRDEDAIRAIIQQHNRRLYRVARGIVGDDGEAEDVLQEAYIRAFAAIRDFRGESRLSTWLTRIVANEALQRLRSRRAVPTDDAMLARAEVIPFPGSTQHANDPERSLAQREICQLVEREIDALPREFRIVLIARVVEGMSVEETAETLGLKPQTVKTRLHRARRMMKQALSERVGAVFSDVFPFDGERCARIADETVRRLRATTGT